MSDFSELIKNFDKIRDYMRDFFIYGFKTRSDFNYKSLRTYDNEKRRIESWLGDLIRFDNKRKGKQIAISLDSGQLSANPLYKSHKSKSFTDNDVSLHFFILDLLKVESELSVEEITDRLCICYGKIFDSQTVRLKLKEYINTGILIQKKCGKTLRYSLSEEYPDTITSNTRELADALTFFSEVLPFGVVGSYLLDKLNVKNETFLFKHHFIVHTLDDHILLTFITAIEEKRSVDIVNFGKRKLETHLLGVPMKLFVSTQTGRQYIILYNPSIKRFNSYRLDYIKSVKLQKVCEDFASYKALFDENKDLVWGVSFGSTKPPVHVEEFKMVLRIDEQREQYILDRLKREGRNGTITHIGEDTYSFTITVFDTNEMMNWVKTFIGRIITLEGSNQQTISNFYRDMIRMKNMYEED
jgi:hypothetical protein